MISGRRAALLVALAVGVLLGTPVLCGEAFYFRDVSQNHGPLIQAAWSMLRSGELPWWNPWASGGEPFFANPNCLLLTPLGLVAGALPKAGLSVAIVLSSMLASAFVVLLLRDAGLSPQAAAAGGLVHGLSGVMLSIGSLPNVLAAWSWVPPALYFIRRAHDSRGWIVPASLASAFALLPCEPASALALVAFALLPMPVDRRAIPIGARVRVASMALAAGALLACVQIVPAMLWISASSRGAGLPVDEIVKWSLDFRRLPEMVAPGILGDPASLAGWWGGSLFPTRYPFLLSLHVSVPALALAAVGVVAVFRARTPRSVAWPLAGAVLVVLAGGGLIGMLAGLPGIETFRYPEKLLVGATLALAACAACGLDAVARSESREKIVAIVVAGLAACLLLVASVGTSPAAVAAWLRMDADAARLRDVVLSVHSSLLLGALGALVLVAAVAASFRWTRATGSLVVAALSVALVLGAVNWQASRAPCLRVLANPSAPAEMFRPEPLFADRLAGLDAGGQRLVRFTRPPGFASRAPTGTMADLFSWETRSLERASASALRIPLAFDRSTDRVDPAGASAAMTFSESLPTDVRARFWSLAAARYVLSYAPLDALALAAKVEGESATPVLLYEVADPLPRARMFGTALRVATDEEAFHAMATAPGDEWRDACALVGSEATGRATLASASVDSREARILERGPGRMKVSVAGGSDAQASHGWLVVAENDVPGWTARVDGREVVIARANGMHLAVEVPPGAHEVTLAYSPPGLVAGALLTLLGAALLILLVRSRRAWPTPPGPSPA